jgi:hypothetical protein
MRRALCAGVVGLAASCIPANAPPPVEHWDYVVTPPTGTDHIVHVEAELTPASRLFLPHDAMRGISSLEQKTAKAWHVVTPNDDGWPLDRCDGTCVVRYSLDLEALVDACDGDMDCGADVNGSVISSVSSWLVRPPRGNATVTLRVSGDGPFAFGMHQGSPKTYEFRSYALGEGSYTAFGPLRVRHARDVDVAILGGGLKMGDDATVRWIDDATATVARFYGRFPAPATLFVLPIPGEAEVRFGSVMALTGASIALFVGSELPPKSEHFDWVVVHELTHLGAPTFVGEGRWVEEGVATYFEPIERERAGWMTEEELWTHFANQMPRGVRPPSSPPDIEDRHGVDTAYWGGALFMLLADVRIRDETHGAHSLDDVMRGVLAHGGDVTHVWKLKDFFAYGDSITGTHVLGELAESYGERGDPVDLAAELRALGVVATDGGIKLDETAPRAKIRRSIGAR